MAVRVAACVNLLRNARHIEGTCAWGSRIVLLMFVRYPVSLTPARWPIKRGMLSFQATALIYDPLFRVMYRCPWVHRVTF